MGTTLTGTTPANTYDSLIKVTDNGPLSGTAKYLSDGLGNDSALALSTGNVGIGMNSPVVKLAVSDGTNAFQVGHDANGPYISGANNAFTVYKRLSYDATEHIFYSSSSEKMRITSAGNVGIGNSIPSSFLSNGNQLVVGSGAAAQGITIYSDTAGTGNLFFADGTAGDAAYRGFLRYDHNDDSMKIYTGGANERMRITAAGNVGIGTSGAILRLDVKGAAADTTTFGGVTVEQTTLFRPSNDLGGMRFGFDASSNAYLWSATSGASLRLGTRLAPDNNVNMTLLANGNVGIGTTSPNVKLEVSSSDTSSGGIVRVKNNRTALFDGDTNGEYQFANDESSGGAGGIRGSIVSKIRDTAGKSDMYFTTASSNGSATEKVRILADGGITFNGDTAAANALDDYEEGTWTMGVSFGGASTGISYGVNTGAYTKVGRKVTVTGYLTLTNKGTATGNARITGLPFVIGNDNSKFSPASLWFDKITYTGQITMYGNISNTTLDFINTDESGNTAILQDTNFANNTRVMISLTYFV